MGTINDLIRQTERKSDYPVCQCDACCANRGEMPRWGVETAQRTVLNPQSTTQLEATKPTKPERRGEIA
jgi:hypothetical protein